MQKGRNSNYCYTFQTTRTFQVNLRKHAKLQSSRDQSQINLGKSQKDYACDSPPPLLLKSKSEKW